MRPSSVHRPPAAAWPRALAAVVALACLAVPHAAPALASKSRAKPPTVMGPADPGGAGAPIAGAFVYPVGDEVDYTKARSGEGSGFYVSDPYLASRGKRKHRVHYGADLSNRRGGAEVRAIAAGVVVVSERNALVKVRKKRRVKVPVLVDGKRTYKRSTRYRTTYVWRTGWGNRVVVRHTLPNGDVVYSLYAHLKPKSVLVRAGEVVAAGQPIAQVGRTGRASSPHLHIEIRKALADDNLEEGVGGASGSPSEFEAASAKPLTQSDRDPEVRTVDPMAFLERHVVRFRDLEPGTWQARYALAACRDGILAGDGDHFEPDESITRADFYRALVLSFRLGTPFTGTSFESTCDALVDAGILDPASGRKQRAGDAVIRSDALELVLRCADRSAARGRGLARIETAQVCRDFNRTFAGIEAAAAADREARTIAAAETAARRKAAREQAAAAAKRAKARGKRAKSTVAAVKPVAPVPRLDAGFESLAQSDKRLSRVETCLLLASALRIQPNRISALERAASRSANSG